MRRGLISLVAGAALFVAPIFVAAPAVAQGTIQQSGPATPNDALCFVGNGVAKDCGFPPAAAVPGACPVRIIPSGTSDVASSADCSLAWNSASTGNKTQFLYACQASTKSFILIVSDEAVTAGTYSITLMPNGTNKIGKAATFAMLFNGQSQTLQCDGAGNWIPE